jgi:hypothetical protein
MTSVVDDDLDESHRVPVAAEPAARLTAVRIQPGDPGLVVVTRQRREFDDRPVRASAESPRNPGALGKVVVIDPGPVGVEVVAGSCRRSPVDLDPAVHFSNALQ